jgi:hypothetical protein
MEGILTKCFTIQNDNLDLVLLLEEHVSKYVQQFEQVQQRCDSYLFWVQMPLKV